MRRVPKSCRGYCSGFWQIRSIARSSSSRNIPAARLLRCAYQSTAASASSSAAGWIRRDSPLTAPAGREGAFVRRSRRSVPRFHRQFASAEARSPSSMLLSHLRRRSRPGSRSGNRSARNALPGALVDIKTGQRSGTRTTAVVPWRERSGQPVFWRQSVDDGHETCRIKTPAVQKAGVRATKASVRTQVMLVGRCRPSILLCSRLPPTRSLRSLPSYFNNSSCPLPRF